MSQERKVAVTGLGCITPVGNNVSSFWENISTGKHGIAPITAFDTADFPVKLAAEVKGFDPKDYPDTAKGDGRRADRNAQFALIASREAVESSGIARQIDSERLGVYIGTSSGALQMITQQHEKYLENGPDLISAFFAPYAIPNAASSLTAIKYNAKGPCLPIMTACATASHSIGEAYRAIKHGYADAVIAGGTDATILPLIVGGFAACGALHTGGDPDAASIPFDKRRRGFVMGEGAGILVLEELEHALTRKAEIYCMIDGYGNTCDASHITLPAQDVQSATRVILEAAGREFDTEGLYINAHGTSTPINDPTETRAIKQAFGNAAYGIPVSSTKSMTGHMLGAAGGAEAIACIMALKHGILPPTAGLTEPDDDCDLDYVPCKARKYPIRSALSLSFGFGGQNAALLFKKL